MTTTLGNQIRAIRRHKGLTQVQLAKKAGVYKNSVPRLESGGNVSVATLVKICGALGYYVSLRLITAVSTTVNFHTESEHEY